MVKSMVLRELHTLEETTMDKVRFLMSDTGAPFTAACREADKASRPYSIQASVAFLSTTLVT